MQKSPRESASTVPAKGNGETALTRAERENLLRLAKMRERVAKTGLTQRSAQLLAEFEQQMASEYSYDQDATWKAAVTVAGREVKKAEAQIAERCRELGIPDRFAPGLHLSWYDRGENAVGKRRTELRFVARSRIAEIEKTARSTIVQASLEVQTEILRTALGSAAAVTFLDRMPSVEQLMPPLTIAAIEQMLEPRQAGKQRVSLLTEAAEVADTNAAIAAVEAELDGEAAAL
jgi:hypothetical protein